MIPLVEAQAWIEWRMIIYLFHSKFLKFITPLVLTAPRSIDRMTAAAFRFSVMTRIGCHMLRCLFIHQCIYQSADNATGFKKIKQILCCDVSLSYQLLKTIAALCITAYI